VNEIDIELGRKFVEHRDFSTKEREKLSEKGQAMPGGGYPIRNRQDLKNAIQAIGRAKNPAAAKAWIIKRARALGLTDLLPDGWVAVHSNVIDFIDHHGIKGMRWGVRGGKGRPTAKTERTRFAKSPKRLTNTELERRIKRMETEKRYNDLNKRDISPGQKLATEILTNVGRTAVTTVATGALLFGVKAGLSKKFGPEAASAITKRGKK
jgi:hypothetical protein